MKKKISLVQMDVKFAAPEENYQHAINLMGQALEDNPDIIVLPEAFNTGFFPKENLEKIADKDGKKTKEIIGQFAKENEVNVVAGSVAVLKNDELYNTLYAFDRSGNVVAEYDKVHSFSPLDEHLHFKGGDHIVNFQLDGIDCSAVICYDIRFPELIRAATVKGVDLMFIPAAWPEIRTHHWVTLGLARAIENQMFVCTVNQASYAEETKYGGHSMLIDPFGEEILHLGDNEEVQTGEIDLDTIEGIRESINVYRDRQPELYKKL